MPKKRCRAKPSGGDSDVSVEEQHERDVLKLLDARHRLPRSVYKLAAGTVGMDTITQPAVDAGAMSAAAVISTPSPDRDGDIMLPRGVQLENYRKNPVVLWEHGLGGIHTPIAKSEDAEGRLALRVCDDRIEATAYFTNSVRESEQIFALIAERIVRAASIRADVVKSRIELRGGEKFFVAEEWELVEWSWGGLGVNPDAVAKLISQNRLAGGPICEAVLKSLRPYAPIAPAFGRGWTASTALSVAEGEQALADQPGFQAAPPADLAADQPGETELATPPVDPKTFAHEDSSSRLVATRLHSLEKTLTALRNRLDEITPHPRSKRIREAFAPAPEPEASHG